MTRRLWCSLLGHRYEWINIPPIGDLLTDDWQRCRHCKKLRVIRPKYPVRRPVQ